MLLLVLFLIRSATSALSCCDTYASGGFNWEREYGPVIAINFGSSYAQVGLAVGREDRIDILKDDMGRSIIPTRACFTTEGTLAYGYACPDVLDGSVIHDIRKYVEWIPPPSKELTEETLFDCHDQITPSEGLEELSRILENGQTVSYTPAEVVLGFLNHIQQLASTYYGQKIISAQVAVPTFLAKTYRPILLRIAPSISQPYRDYDVPSEQVSISGSSTPLQILRVLNEPLATLLAHDLLHPPEDQYALTYYLDLEELAPFEVTASFLMDDGMLDILGSEHMVLEDRLEEWLMAELGRKVFPDVWDWYDKLQQLPAVKGNNLKAIARKARADVFSTDEDSIEVLFTEVGYPEVSTVLTKDIFYGLYRDVIFRTIDLSMKALRSAAQSEHKAGIWNLDKVVLSGKSSTHPLVNEILMFAFPNVTVITHSHPDPDSNKTKITPDTAAVIGAARNAASSYQEGCVGCFEIAAMDIGVELDGGVVGVIIPRNSVLLTGRTRRVNITTNDIRIYGGFGRYTNNTVLIGTLDLPAGEGEVIVKISPDPFGRFLEAEAQRDGFDGETTRLAAVNIPGPWDLWPEDEISRMIDEAWEFDRNMKEASAL